MSTEASRQAVPLWDQNPEFVALYSHIQDATIIRKQELFKAFQFAKNVMNIAGDAAEVGVGQGGAAYLLASVLRKAKKPLHLFDTFLDTQEPRINGHPPSALKETSLAGVKSFLQEFEDVQFHPGVFPSTAAAVAVLKFAFVHVDVDAAATIIASCEFFYPRMTAGGFLAINLHRPSIDPAAVQAVEGFCEGKQITPLLMDGTTLLIVKR